MRAALYDSSLVKKGRGYVVLPIRLPEAWQVYKSAQATFWTAEDIINQPVPVEHAVNADLTLVLYETVTALRAAALPETMSVLVRDLEIVCFLSFQAMQENIHLETVAALALSTDDLTGGDIIPLGWPKPRTPYAESDSGLIVLIEHAAIYASITAKIKAFAPDCIGDTLLTDATKRVARDYGRSYELALILCAIVCGGPDTDVPTFLEAARGIVELVTSECGLPAPLKSSVCDEFVEDLGTAFSTIPYRDTKCPEGGAIGQGATAETRGAPESFSTDEAF